MEFGPLCSPWSLWFGRSSTTSWRLVKEFHAMTMRLRSVQSTILFIGTSQARPSGFASGLLLLCWWSWVSTPAFSVAGMPVPDVAGLRQGRRMLRQLRHHKQGTTGPRVHHDDTTSRTADMLSFSAWSRRFLNLKQQLYGDRVQDWTSFAIFCFPCPLGWWFYAERQFFRCQPVGIFNSSKAKEAHESFERWLLQVLHHVTSKIHQDSSFGYGSIPINAIFRGMNIHLPAILMFTRGTRFWHTAIFVASSFKGHWHLSCGRLEAGEMKQTIIVAFGAEDEDPDGKVWCLDPLVWVNYNDLTATSLESWLVREIIPKWP